MDTIQMTLRGMPVRVADTLRAQAKAEGKSLNRYMIDRLSRESARFEHQQALSKKYRRTGSGDEAFAEARQLIDGLKDDWE